MQQANALNPEQRWTTLSVVWTDDEGIRSRNLEWFGKDTVTDVISFRYDAMPGEEGDAGELLVNLSQAWHEGALREGPQDELALYLAHGCDHLHGAEDDTPEAKDRMLTREKAWVQEARQLGLIANLYATRDFR